MGLNFRVLLIIWLVCTSLLTAGFVYINYKNNELVYRFGWMYFKAMTYEFYVDDRQIISYKIFLNFEHKTTYGIVRKKYKPYWIKIRTDTTKPGIRSGIISFAFVVVLYCYFAGWLYYLGSPFRSLWRIYMQRHKRQRDEAISTPDPAEPEKPNEVKQDAPPEISASADAPVATKPDTDIPPPSRSPSRPTNETKQSQSEKKQSNAAIDDLFKRYLRGDD